ncbi:phage regulatory CII family protein [Methylobacillus pratensis]
MPNDLCLRDTVYHLAHDYPGGVPALAARMDKNPTVLMHKLNPNNTTHHLTAHELDALDDLTGTTRIAEYFAHKHGFLLVQALVPGDEHELPLMDHFMVVGEKLGNYCQEFREAYADREITKAEWKRIKRKGVELRQEIVALSNRIHLMVKD